MEIEILGAGGAGLSGAFTLKERGEVSLYGQITSDHRGRFVIWPKCNSRARTARITGEKSWWRAAMAHGLKRYRAAIAAPTGRRVDACQSFVTRTTARSNEIRSCCLTRCKKSLVYNDNVIERFPHGEPRCVRCCLGRQCSTAIPITNAASTNS